MMTKNKTDRHAAWKYALVMPLLLGLVVVFSSPEIKGDIQKVIADIITDTIPATQSANLNDVQTLSVKNETIKITLKNGVVESYDLSDSKESEIFQEKYGELAPPPPPPPPPMLHGNALIPEGVESIKVEEDRIIVKHTNGISKFFYLSDQGDMKTYKNFYGEIPKPPAPPSVNEQIPPPPPPPIPSNVKAITQFLGQKSKPLFVLDGNKLESDQKLNLHPGDIENVSVLKGQSATNLYGEEGNNGVVIITTKSAIKEIFRVVEQMPRFPGCEDINNDKEKEDCARTKLLEYIYRNLKYPAEARKKNIEGQVVVQFVIKPDGLIKDVKVVREIGEGCGSEVKILVEGMNKMAVRWIPGKQHGKYVNVLYTLPVKFALQGNDGKSINNNETPHIKPISNGEIFKVVDQMPRFPGCEDQPVEHERDDCAKTKMLEYIYQNLKYPQEARKNQVEGQVVLQFVVRDDGSLGNIKIARDIGAGCGEAAAHVIESMNDKSLRWIPGVQNGQNVDVLYTLPVKFKLEGNKRSSNQESKPIVDYFTNNVNWKECAELDNIFGRMKCSIKKTNDFIKLHLNYPSEARKNNIEGSCKIRAYYNEKGILTKAEIMEDIGHGCGEEALRVVKLMPEMSPAQKDGKPVNGSLPILINFSLNSKVQQKNEAKPNNSSIKMGISEDRFKVKPNPAKESIEFLLSTCLPEDLTVAITDIQGKMLFQKKYKNDYHLFSQQIDIREYNTDILILSVTQGDKTVTKKIVVSK
ncbi:MAG: TonB family protein [Saprospiraceae bacterium]|nr:TonB family protein [Saprospiraceae bacterium]